MMSETDPEKSNLLPELSNCKKSVGVESKHSANLNPVSEKLTLQQPQKCNKPLNNKRTMERHILDGNEKHFQCKQVKSSFEKQPDLKVHI